MVTGAAKPVMLKPVPVAAMEEIVALAFPELVSVTVCWPLLPTETFPNETLAGLAPSVALVATPVPERARVCGEFGALSVKLMLPWAPPAAVGANCAEKVMDWPAGKVFGRESPDMPNAPPLTVAKLMMTSDVPVLVSLTFSEVVWPTIVLEKFQLDGETERPACAPVPVSETSKGESVASLMILMVPLVAPATVGANWTWAETLCPTAIVPEGIPPTTVKAEPVMDACAMVTEAVPVLVTVKVCIEVFATATSPNPSVEV